MILVYPPVSRPSEPPAAFGRLSAYLSMRGIPHECIDGNSECFNEAVSSHAASDDTWTRRAFRRKDDALLRLQSMDGYSCFDSYVQDVSVLSRVVSKSGLFNERFTVSLADYQDEELSPYRSGDIRRAYREYEENPYFFWFSLRITNALNALSSAGEQWLGLSVSYLSQVLTAFSIIGFVKAGFPAVKIVLGGGLLRSWMDNEHFNAVCAETGVLPWYESGEEFIDTHVCPGGSLSLPSGKCCVSGIVPDVTFAGKNTYIAPGMIIPYSPTLGCSYRRCAFCSETFEGVAFSSPGNNAAYKGYIELSERYNPVCIHFCDHEMSPGLLRILAGSEAAGVPWYGFSRVIDDFLVPDFCARLARSGCRMLCLGIESGSQEVLDAMKKGIRIDSAGRALENLAAAGISTFCYFLFGTPWETCAAAKETAVFIQQHHDCITWANISIFNLPAKSPLSRRLETRPFSCGDLSLYREFSHPFGWDRRTVRNFIDKELRADPCIRTVLQRTPPVFTSSHAVFFTPYS